MPPKTAPSSESNTFLLRVYRLARITRAVDEHLWLLSRLGRAGFVITARGHEVAQITTALSVRRGVDSLWPYYRDMGVGIALGVRPFEIFLGALGRAGDGHSGGRQLTGHLSSAALRIGTVSSAIAAHIPHAVGAAYAARVRRKDSVAFCWFGDGATSEGATHEAMNLASVHALPIVFICENNGLAISVPLSLQMGITHVSDRAAAYGMPGVTVDGTDALALQRAIVAAVDLARSGGGPTLLEAIVPRMTPHSSQDDDAYRSPRELEVARNTDPLPRLRDDLMERGVLTAEEDESLIQRIEWLVLAEAEAAHEADEPTAGRAHDWLLVGGRPHEPASLGTSQENWSRIIDA
jgi:2-oxoisovalerate dehydrogenase E1 component alpha subunit